MRPLCLLRVHNKRFGIRGQRLHASPVVVWLRLGTKATWEVQEGRGDVCLLAGSKHQGPG